MQKKIFFLLILFAESVLAYESVEVVGLFPGKVVVVADGEQLVLSRNIAKKGLTFIAADGDLVSINVNGVVKKIKLGSKISTNFTPPSVTRLSIRSNNRGMFLTSGSINGQLIEFLVDTGATTVAMSSKKAKNLGIQYRLKGKETVARTASGRAKAYLVKLKSVSVGQIKQHNVDAIVIDGAYPVTVLLGMSFLNRLKVQKQGGLMVLESK